MVFKKLFKDKESDISASLEAGEESLIHRLARHIRGTFDLDDFLQMAANGLGEQLNVDHCLIYLCDPNVNTLRWRAGTQRSDLAPLRWPLRESDFPDLFVRLRKPEIVCIANPLGDPLVASARARFESAKVRTLVFAPAFGEQLEAIIILAQVNQARQWSEEELQFLDTVAVQVALASQHTTLSSALRRAGTQVYSATAELQTENQQLQGLVQLLLLPPADLSQISNHICESLAELYHLKACTIEEIQAEMTTVRSICLSGRTTNLGVFEIAGTPRQQVVESADQVVIFNAMEAYPEDRFLLEHELNFYAGIPIVSRAGEVIALLNLFNPEPVNLQKRDLKTLASIARRIGAEMDEERRAGALHEAEQEIKWRLEATSQWEEQLKILHEARELLRQSDSLQAGLQELVITANKHIGSDFAAIALFDENKQFGELITAGIDPTVREAIGHLPTGRGVLGTLVDWNGPLRLDNIAHHPRFTGFPANHPVMRTLLAVPLRVRGDTAGALYFADKNGGEPFSNEDELFATELAAQIALAVATPAVIVHPPIETTTTAPAVSEQPTTDQGPQPTDGDRFTPWPVFSELFTLIQQGAPVEQVCASLVEALTELFPGSATAIWVLDPPRERLVEVAGRGAPTRRLADKGPIRLGEELLGRVASSGQMLAVRVNEPTDQQVDGSVDSLTRELRDLISPDEPYTCATILPFKTRDETLGLIVLFGADSYLTEQEPRAFLEVVGYCLGSLVERARMLETASLRRQEMAKMQTVIKSISAATRSSLDEICDDILDDLVDSLSISHGAVYLYHVEERELRLFRHRGLDEPLVELGQRIPLEAVKDSLTALSTTEPLIISELETDPSLKNRELVEQLQSRGLRSGAVLPLRTIVRSEDPEAAEHSALVGLLLLASPQPNYFAHYPHEFFSILTSRLANTVEQVTAAPGAPLLESPAHGTVAAQFNETLLENLSSGVVAIDRNGDITIFNPAIERLTGHRRHEVLGHPIGEVGVELFASGNPFNEVMVQGRVLTYAEVQLLMRGGGKKYASLTVIPLADERGALSGAVGVFNDITELRALEHERYRLTPLALIGEMSARLAHEIKNPLASMMSGLELLMRRLQYSEREAQYFDRLIAELQRLDTTVREMLAYSRTTPPTLAPVDPAEPLERALDTLIPQLDAAHVTVQRDYQLGMPPVLMDANQMEQVFLNLIVNAIHAMPDGGTLTTSLRMVPAPASEGEALAPLIEYTVTDTGVGIPPDALDKIFDPFFSTKTHGSGLGLASVQKITETHQGQINVESELGQGTTFTIRLKQQPTEVRDSWLATSDS